MSTMNISSHVKWKFTQYILVEVTHCTWRPSCVHALSMAMSYWVKMCYCQSQRLTRNTYIAINKTVVQTMLFNKWHLQLFTVQQSKCDQQQLNLVSIKYEMRCKACHLEKHGNLICRCEVIVGTMPKQYSAFRVYKNAEIDYNWHSYFDADIVKTSG